MLTQLIVSADDFGLCPAVNSAVEKARREGVLTAASLMVTGEAADEAVEIARADPDLAVGLHVTLGLGSPAAAGLRCQFSRAARQRIRSEIEAQFEAFAATGLPLSHVDGHQHLHCLPAALPTVVELALRFGARGIRFPNESLGFGLRIDRSRLAYKLASALGLAYFRRVARRTPGIERLACCELSVGTLMSGRMTDDYVIALLSRARAASIELFFHPAEGAALDPCGPNPGDLDALTSAKLREFIAAGGYELTTYAGLPGAAEVSRG